VYKRRHAVPKVHFHAFKTATRVPAKPAWDGFTHTRSIEPIQTWRALLAGFPRFHHKPNLKVDDVVYGIGTYPPSCLNATGIRGAGGVRAYPIEYFLTYNTTCTASMSDICQIEG